MAPRTRGQTPRAPASLNSSWRMVEGGENDSFDTTVVQAHDADVDELDRQALEETLDEEEERRELERQLRYAKTKTKTNTQTNICTGLGGESFSSGTSTNYDPGSSMASQDSIRDFHSRADEDQIIMRSPFAPSLLTGRHAHTDEDKTPVPEFFMPKVDVDSPRRSKRLSQNTREFADGEQQPQHQHQHQQQQAHLRRRRQDEQRMSGDNGARQKQRHGHYSNNDNRQHRENSSRAVPDLLLDILSWCLSVVSMALHYAKWPLALVLSIYITIGAGMVAKNMITDSITASLSPFCRIPGASLLDLPFCPGSTAEAAANKTQFIEFDELVDTQLQFEKVLSDAAQGVSLPLEMKRSEASVRDLRTMVKFSDLPAREELVLEFDGYIDTVRILATDLQLFNTHVGSAVDSVISINRWTSRYIDSVSDAIASRAAHAPGRFSLRRLWTPFLPIGTVSGVWDERHLLDKYVEHTSLVSDKIAALILEAHAALRLLAQAENHLLLIHEHVLATGRVVRDRESDILWTLWTLLGANRPALARLRAQIALLRSVEAQRNAAVAQLVGLVHDLSDIQTKLSDLRDRVAAPALTADGPAPLPLSVHIETIDAGVRRLEEARSRIRQEENGRLAEVLARGREENQRGIEG